MAIKDHLALYSSNCKRCKALDPDEKKTFVQCHYSKGNKHCPASEVRIVVVGKAYRYADQVKEARDRRDVVTEARILGLVGKCSRAFQAKFYEAVEGNNV